MLIIGGVVASLAVFNGMYPAITQTSGAITSAANKLSDRIESRIEIIQVGDNSAKVDAWVKNVGISEIVAIDNSDIFFGPTDNFTRITYGGGTPPYWDYQLEGGNSQWTQSTTLKVTIHLDSAPSSGTYLIKVVIPNGIFDKTIFSVE